VLILTPLLALVIQTYLPRERPVLTCRYWW
jgi:hypothetical protein